MAQSTQQKTTPASRLAAPLSVVVDDEYTPVNLLIIFHGRAESLTLRRGRNRRQTKIERLREEIHTLFGFAESDTVYIKWVDPEQDVCAIASDAELDEALAVQQQTRRQQAMEQQHPAASTTLLSTFGSSPSAQPLPITLGRAPEAFACDLELHIFNDSFLASRWVANTAAAGASAASVSRNQTLAHNASGKHPMTNAPGRKSTSSAAGQRTQARVVLGHTFTEHRLSGLTRVLLCAHCKRTIWGLRRTYHACVACRMAVHNACIEQLWSVCAKAPAKDTPVSVPHTFTPRHMMGRRHCMHCGHRISTRIKSKCATCALLVHPTCEALVPQECSFYRLPAPAKALRVLTTTTSTTPPTAPPATRVLQRSHSTPVDLILTNINPSLPDTDQCLSLFGPSASTRIQSVFEHRPLPSKSSHPPLRPSVSLPINPHTGMRSSLLRSSPSALSAIHPAPPFAPSSPPSLSHLPCALDHFSFLHLIGRGSFAHIFLCQNVQSGRLIALKRIEKKNGTDKKDTLHWLNAERQVLQKARHTFIAELQSIFQTTDHIYFAMTFYCGGDLFRRVQTVGALSPDECRFYTAEIAVALDHLHAHSILYRDLRLENVLIDRSGHIRLTDFAMVKLQMDSDSHTNSLCGTPTAMAPEMVHGQPYGFPVDFWALGVCLYEMAYGRMPFQGHTVSATFRLISTAMPQLPPTASADEDTRTLLLALLDKDPSARPTMEVLMYHPFFVRNASNIIRFWSTVESGLLPPPFVPQSHSTVDLRYFDPQLSQVDIGKDSDSPAECDPSAFWPDFDWSHSRQHDTSV